LEDTDESDATYDEDDDSEESDEEDPVPIASSYEEMDIVS
jgi:hypothetical protein